MKFSDFFKKTKPDDNTDSKVIGPYEYHIEWNYYDENYGTLRVGAFDDNEQIGWATLESNGPNTPFVANDLAVSKKYQRQGIASNMYRYAESLGFQINPAPSPEQTPDGQAFWASRSK